MREKFRTLAASCKCAEARRASMAIALVDMSGDSVAFERAGVVRRADIGRVATQARMGEAATAEKSRSDVGGDKRTGNAPSLGTLSCSLSLHADRRRRLDFVGDPHPALRQRKERGKFPIPRRSSAGMGRLLRLTIDWAELKSVAERSISHPITRMRGLS
jgi:hypothetical protein